MQDDLETFEEYSRLLRILESAKLSARDIDTLGDLEYRIQLLTEEQSELALQMFQDGII